MLSFAAGCGSERLFKVVMEKENTLLSNDSVNKRIMRSAIMGGFVGIVNLLLSKNIPLNNDANRYGWTPAHYAAAKGHAAMIRFLAEKNFNLNLRTLSGKSIYNIAEENNQHEMLKTIKALNGDTSPKQFPELTGAYLGQTTPVREPALFAPDIVSTSDGDDNHGSIAFTPDGNEIYWNNRGKIWLTKLRDSKWTEPEKISFSTTESFMDDNPFITSDGKKMFFTSTRPDAISERKENIWYVERTSSEWSEPRPISAEVNAIQLHWSVSAARSGTLYFGGTGPDGYGGGDIYYSKLVNGVYMKPVNIGPEINSKELDHCPYIAPDESYLIFSRFSNIGSGYYISYRDKSGKWLPAIKLHGGLEGVCTLVSPDGKYFFFNSDGIYWLPAKFIEDLRPKE